MTRTAAFRHELDAGADGLAGRSPALAFLAEHGEDSLRRTGGPEHFTASCVVIDPEARSVLLHHHRKADAWGQFGGHIDEDDTSFRDAARRECREESGIESFAWFSPAPIDLHLHELSGDFGACRAHRDVVFAAYATVGTRTAVSAESHDVAWFALDALPEEIMPDLPARLPGLVAAAERLHGED